MLDHESAISKLVDLHPDALKNDTYLVSRYKQMTGKTIKVSKLRQEMQMLFAPSAKSVNA